MKRITFLAGFTMIVTVLAPSAVAANPAFSAVAANIAMQWMTMTAQSDRARSNRTQSDRTQASPETDGRAVEGNVTERGVIFVSNDTGGLVAEYAVRVAEARKSKTHVVISGRCQSACTIYTALVPDRLACATPGTTLEFHKPRNREGQSTDALDELFLSFLPDELSQYITENGGLPASGFRVVAASRFVPPCVLPQ
jgi:hypothetical protein